jgi:hypothetical protein
MLMAERQASVSVTGDLIGDDEDLSSRQDLEDPRLRETANLNGRACLFPEFTHKARLGRFAFLAASGSRRRVKMEPQWLASCKRLKAVAATGVHFARDDFDKERYAEIGSIADVGRSAADNVVKELYEEAGLAVTVSRLTA